MRALYSLVADSANISQEGKLNVLGAFTQIRPLASNLTYPLLCYVLAIEFSQVDHDIEREVTIRLVDQDGNTMGPPVGMQVRWKAKAQTAGQPGLHSIILPVSMLRLPGSGIYSFEAWWDGTLQSETRFSVSPPPKASG